MHWQQWFTLIIFFLGFGFNVAVASVRPDKAQTFYIGCLVMLFYQWVLWTGGWYS
jgi:hypothetical protein